MKLKKILDELKRIRIELERLNEKMDIIIKRITILHNSKNAAYSKALAWLTPEQRIRAKELEKENPETYRYVTEVLKLFVSGD